MRVSLTPTGLAEVINDDKSDPVWYGQLSGSIWAVTQKLLKEYESAVRTKSNYYYPLFDSLVRNDRLQEVDPNDISAYGLRAVRTVGADPLGAAFHSGLVCLGSEEEATAADVAAHANGYGITFDKSSGPSTIDVTLPPGDNPIESRVYHDGDILDVNWLRRYFAHERRVVIYDKYLSGDSPEFIGDLLVRVRPTADVRILTSGRSRHGASNSDIQSRVSRKIPSCSVTIHSITHSTFRTFHDRWMFAGSRYEIKFTAGLDHFFLMGGSWRSRDCEVIVRNIYSSNHVREFYVDGGTTIAQKCA